MFPPSKYPTTGSQNVKQTRMCNDEFNYHGNIDLLWVFCCTKNLSQEVGSQSSWLAISPRDPGQCPLWIDTWAKSYTSVAGPHHSFRLSSRSPKTVGSEISMTTFWGPTFEKVILSTLIFYQQHARHKCNEYIDWALCGNQLLTYFWATCTMPACEIISTFRQIDSRRCTNNSSPPGSVMEGGTETRNFKGVA